MAGENNFKKPRRMDMVSQQMEVRI